MKLYTISTNILYTILPVHTTPLFPAVKPVFFENSKRIRNISRGDVGIAPYTGLCVWDGVYK